MKKFMFAAIAAMVMVSVSNVFASSRMVGNAEVAPVDTVAPDAPSDTTEVGTPIQPQATTEDSTQQEDTSRNYYRYSYSNRREHPGRAASYCSGDSTGEFPGGDNSAAGVCRDRTVDKC